jgi:hypothetical protein
MNVTGVAGSEDTFQSRLPTYSTAAGVPSAPPPPPAAAAAAPGRREEREADLVSTLAYYLQHPQPRQALAGQLRAEVLAKHTYRIRAQELVAVINTLVGGTGDGGSGSGDDSESGSESESGSGSGRESGGASSGFIQRRPERCVRASESAACRAPLAAHLQLQVAHAEASAVPDTPAICIGVRTHAGGCGVVWCGVCGQANVCACAMRYQHIRSLFCSVLFCSVLLCSAGQSTVVLDMLLRSLLLQWNSSELRDRLLLHAFVVDTDLVSGASEPAPPSHQQHQQRRQELQSVVDAVNTAIVMPLQSGRHSPDPRVSSQAVLAWSAEAENRRVKNFMFGYDDSEWLLQHLMKEVSKLDVDAMGE